MENHTSTEPSLYTTSARNLLILNMPTAQTWKLKSPLLKRMREIMRAEHKSISTEDAYVNWCASMFAWANCGSLDCLNGAMVERYLTHLAVDRKVADETIRQARRALELLMIANRKPRKCRLSRNILTRSEIKSLMETMPEKYRAALHDTRTIREAAKIHGGHRNSIQFIVRYRTRKLTGNSMTVPGFKRSLILQELIESKDWEAVETKWGDQAVKTACREFVRCFPKTLEDNLAC